MPTYEIDLPDGRSFEVDAPNDAALNVTVRALMGPTKPGAISAETDRAAVSNAGGLRAALRGADKGVQRIKSEAKGAVDTALTLASTVPAGFAYMGGTLGTAAAKVATGDIGTYRNQGLAERVIERQSAPFIRTPTTPQGARNMNALALALESVGAVAPLSQFAAVSSLARPSAGVARQAGNRVADAGRGASSVASQQLRRAVSGANAGRERARINARTEPSMFNPSVRVPPEAAAAERAQAYAADRVGIRLDDLPAEIRTQIETIARDAQALEGLDPAAIRRQATLAGLPVPVPATRGQLTRDLAQIKREENIRATDLGEPLMDVMARQDEALGANLQSLRGRATATTPQQYGQSVQGALTAKQRALQSRSNALYEQARESGAMAEPVEVSLLDEWLTVPANQRNAGWLKGALDDYRSGPNGRVTINDLEMIRSEATKASNEGGRAGHYAGQAVGVIDDILDGAAQAGSPYRAARASYRAMKQEFEAQALVDKLTNKARGSLDRRVALEDTIDTVLRGSAEQVASLRHSLLTGGTGQTRMQGLQAWRDVRGGVIERLRQRAAGSKGEGTSNAAGDAQFNGGAFIKEFDTLDADGMLAEMFTSKELKTLRDLRKAVETTRVMPSGRMTGSDSIPRLLSMLEKYGSNLPIGNIGRGLLNEGVKLYEKGKAAQRAQQAVVPPLTEAAARIKQRPTP